MISNTHFDYIIIGNGLAGLQLALKMSADVYFKDKHIALIDGSNKNTNDKTWSFWEKNSSQWDAIITKSWNVANIYTSKKHISLALKPYQYKSIRSIDFYNYAKFELQKHSNFSFIIDFVSATTEIEDKKVLVETSSNTYTASHVFDSRIPEDFHLKNKHYTNIIQHFKGYVIKTEEAYFNDDTFTMMDYRLKDGKQTTFTYVLPFSKTEALIEFTYFTENLVDESVYDAFIEKYIKNYLKIDSYLIIETEMGQIPMTNFPFEKFNTKNITKIGTGGGWVKGSTGYSFKHTEKKVSKIIENIKANDIPSAYLFKKKYRFYDKIFLKVLKDDNHKGEWIFEQFYNKNSPQNMFKFLDEESTFLDEIKIMYSLFSWSFIKAFFKTIF